MDGTIGTMLLLGLFCISGTSGTISGAVASANKQSPLTALVMAGLKQDGGTHEIGVVRRLTCIS